MSDMMNFCEIVLQHVKEYPLMQPTDAVKLAYQSEFGPAHMISDLGQAELRIARERKETGKTDAPLCSDIGGGYVRLNLNSTECDGLSSGLIARIFAESAKTAEGSSEGFHQKLAVIRKMAVENAFPFTADELEEYLREYENAGCPPVSHSSVYKEAYAPSYRVIRASFVGMLPVFRAIERLLADSGKERVLVAIDGYAAAGKTTLAKGIAALFDCTVFHMDDFFLPPSLRTKERLAEAGGNVHYERFHDEVLLPLTKGKTVSYGVFDCSQMKISRTATAEPKRLNIIEGSYSHHPRLSAYYDLRIFLDVSEEVQEERILRRNGDEMARKFKEIWIPMEKRYFSSFEIKERSHLAL